MSNKFLKLLLIPSMVTATSCSSINIQTYKDQKPDFNIEQFFNGKLEAHGFFQDRSGVIVKKIHCVMNASWTNGVGTIQEDFDYSDGTTSKRTWILTKQNDQSYVGKAADVIGEAKAVSAGYAFNMSYVLDLDIGKNKTLQVSMDDWMYRMNDQVILNKTKMSKWGVYLGEVTLTILKK